MIFKASNQYSEFHLQKYFYNIYFVYFNVVMILVNFINILNSQLVFRTHVLNKGEDILWIRDNLKQTKSYLHWYCNSEVF